MFRTGEMWWTESLKGLRGGGRFDRIEEKRDAMQSLILPPPARQALAQAALTYRYGDEHRPVTTADILTPRRREDYGKDLWSNYQTIRRIC